MSRWVHRTDTVTVGDNQQKVRGLSHRERSKFAEAAKKIKAGELSATDLPELVAKLGCVGLEAKDVEDMPADLMDACVTKILELTGVKEEKAAGPGEKKEA